MGAEGGLDRGEALFDSLGHGYGKFCGDSNMQQIGCQCVVLVNRRVWTGSLQHVPGSKWGQGLRRRVRTAQGRVIAAPAGRHGRCDVSPRAGRRAAGVASPRLSLSERRWGRRV